MVDALGQADLGQQLTRALAPLAAADARPDQRHLHVAAGREDRQQVVELEHEADRGAAVDGGRLEPRDRPAVDLDRARVGLLEAADHVEQRALAAARRAGERDELARREPQRGLPHGGDRGRRSSTRGRPARRRRQSQLRAISGARASSTSEILGAMTVSEPAGGPARTPRVTVFGPHPLLTVTIERARRTARRGPPPRRRPGRVGEQDGRRARRPSDASAASSGGETGAVLEPLLERLPGERRSVRTRGRPAAATCTTAAAVSACCCRAPERPALAPRARRPLLAHHAPRRSTATCW